MKSGFVSLIGRPNVGKSTLLNTLINEKIAITSKVAGTTRNIIQGIYNEPDYQIVFMDTPGIIKPINKLGRVTNKQAMSLVKDIDCLLFVVDASAGIGKGDRYIIDILKKTESPVILVLNKIDMVSKEELIIKLQEWQSLFEFKEIIPISAKNDDNVDLLLKNIKNYLQEGNMYYSKDHLTDHPERFVMAEFIREKILYFTRDEIPHSVAIVVERMLEDDQGVEIIATIVCDRKSQKGIIVGKQGSMIKKIRLNAQREMKRFLQVPVHLELYVKVENNWRNKQKYLKEFGYNEDDY